MKKMFIAMAVCAGLLAFASTDFVEAADQQATEAVSLAPSTAVDADTQQLSTKVDEDEC
ncbi:MAG: hypothetical protein IJ668_10585 [Selenomonadaceae bacterium]|nr:hypothetical protein [Selenomonadaceae bacterium]MBR1580915.1 hypothetical protein [Selenomonadaceae bacterium]